MSRTSRFLLLACLGPITGPLAAGLERSIRQGRTAMAWVYGAAIVEAWIVMAAAGLHLGAALGVHLG